MTYLKPNAYSEFLTWSVFLKECNVLAYPKHCETLAYWKPCHIPNFAIIRTLVYLGPKTWSEFCLFKHAYSGIFDNDSYNNINFLLYTLILDNFQGNFKWHTMTSISTLDLVYLKNARTFENSIIIEQILLTFFSENKLYHRRESSLTNLYCLKSKLTIF